MNRIPIARFALGVGIVLLAVVGFRMLSTADASANTAAHLQPPPTNTPPYRLYLPIMQRLYIPVRPCVLPPPIYGSLVAAGRNQRANGCRHRRFPHQRRTRQWTGARSWHGSRRAQLRRGERLRPGGRPSLPQLRPGQSVHRHLDQDQPNQRGSTHPSTSASKPRRFKGYSFFLGNGTLGFQLGIGVGSPICSTAPSASCTNWGSGAFVANGQWRHIAVTVDRSSTTGGRFYVDGVHVATFNPTIRPGSLTNTAPLRMASRSSSVTGLMRGALDEVELFPRVLTPAEVRSIYLAGSSGKCKATPTPTATPTVDAHRHSDATRDANAHSQHPPPRPFYSIIVIKLNATGMTPLPNWRMDLFAGATCQGTPLATQFTDDRGLTDFLDLPAGVYSVREQLQPGYQAQTPICQSVTLGDEQSAMLTFQPSDFPPGGIDEFPSGALLTLDVPGSGLAHVTLNGPSRVQRSDPSRTPMATAGWRSRPSCCPWTSAACRPWGRCGCGKARLARRLGALCSRHPALTSRPTASSTCSSKSRWTGAPTGCRWISRCACRLLSRPSRRSWLTTNQRPR